MCPVNGAITICSVNRAIQCALGMGLVNVLFEWDYPMCPGNRASQCALGMGLANVPSEWG